MTQFIAHGGALFAALLLATAATGATAATTTYTTSLAKAPLDQVQKQAEAGDGTAQLELGHRYYYDKALKDDKKALEWFQKAADQHVGWAEYEAATMYENGEGTAPDPQRALGLYQAAATDGVVRADADLGLMYLEGDGAPKDIVQAVKWLQAGAAADEPRAEYLLAILYRDGQGVDQDYGKARTLFRASAAQRFAAAAYGLGDLIKQGKGGDKDLVEGQAWRIMGKYLEAPRMPNGGQVVGAVLVSPDLTKAQNDAAETRYFQLMDELGFSKTGR